MNKPKNCPKCKSKKVLEIMYGYIPPDVLLNSEEEFYPGGCMVDDDSPAWYCDKCEHTWGNYIDD